ncbi:MAG TPA: hypothetical protein DCW90_00985 [Lachnospiraceae bacterium]|nr:hypothetical protein [Lachnospiraceae bacterium]
MKNLKTNVEYVQYHSICEIVDTLKLASTLSHDKYDSVKLYGDSLFILSVLRYIMSNEKYSDITVASIEITSSTADPVCKDDYVLILYDDELYIQSSWNDKCNCLYQNDAKFTICQYGTPDYILRNVMRSGTPVKICNLELS